MFSLPTFNVSVNVWHAGSTPYVDPPDVVVMGNLAWGKRVSAPASGGTGSLGVVFTSRVLLIPKGTDIRGDLQEASAGGGDFVECPAGSRRAYRAIDVDDLGKGFANEHRGAVLVAIGPWPHPYP